MSMTTTPSSTLIGEQSAQRVRAKREQVLVACKICRARKTKCSGERPRCRQCEMRDQVCEWESIGDEAPRASKRKYQDLEQRSAGLVGRLRDGCSINDLLIQARELHETSDVQASDRVSVTIRQPNMVDLRNARAGLDSGSNQIGGEIYPSSRPILPPISSIWVSSEYPAGSGPSTSSLTPITPPFDNAGGKSTEIQKTASPPSLYERWISQA